MSIYLAILLSGNECSLDGVLASWGVTPGVALIASPRREPSASTRKGHRLSFGIESLGVPRVVGFHHDRPNVTDIIVYVLIEPAVGAGREHFGLA